MQLTSICATVACREANRYEEALLWFNRGLQEYPNDRNNQLGKGAALNDLSSSMEAIEWYLARIAEEQPSLDVLALFWAGLASVELRMSGSNSIAEADRYSAQAFDVIPWESDVQGVRGGVLVEQGKIDEGVDLLERAVENCDFDTDRAVSICYLAIAAARLGDLPSASEYFEQAHQMSPRCPLLSRAKSEIAAATSLCGIKDLQRPKLPA